MSRRAARRKLRRLAGIAVALLLIWAVIHGTAGQQPYYCGSSCYGYHATHSPAQHPLRKLLHRARSRS